LKACANLCFLQITLLLNKLLVAGPLVATVKKWPSDWSTIQKSRGSSGVEQLIRNQQVVGSNPILGSFQKDRRWHILIKASYELKKKAVSIFETASH
jgi:hypothetical protein